MPGVIMASLYVMALMLVLAGGFGALLVAAYAAAVVWPVLVLLMLPDITRGLWNWRDDA